LRFLPPLEAGQPFNPHLVFRGLFVPDAIAAYPHLSHGAKLCYAALLRYGGKDGKAWPSKMRMSQRLAVSRDQMRRYLRELQREQFIVQEIRAGKTSVYQFRWHSCFSNPKVLRKNVHVSKRSIA
jgi:hypothetical protein